MEGQATLYYNLTKVIVIICLPLSYKAIFEIFNTNQSQCLIIINHFNHNKLWLILETEQPKTLESPWTYSPIACSSFDYIVRIDLNNQK